MTIEREVTIAGQTYPVILSDENEALQAAKASRESYCWLMEGKRGKTAGRLFILPLVEDWISTDPEREDADETFLERVVRRHLALPWLIAKLTASSSVNFPRTIRWNRHPLRMPTELFLIGTSARNTGNTSTALPSAVCGRWNAARTVCWLERRG